MRTNRVAFLLAAFACAAGCGGKNIKAPRTVPTSGTVLFKGRPAEGVKVTLHPKFDMGAVKFTPNGVTGRDGRFVLSTAAPEDGAPPGEYTVTFEYFRPGADGRGLDTEFDVWKGKYAKPEVGPAVTVGSSATTLDPLKID